MHFRYFTAQLLLLLFLSLWAYSQDTSPVPVNEVICASEVNYTSMCSSLASNSAYPRSLNTDGSVRIAQTYDWTSGFFPGSLWYLYEYTGNPNIKQNAINRTAPISNQRYNTGTHDLGFMFYCSFGNALRITDSTEYAAILLDAASSLYSRYNPVVGCIRSWDFGSWEFPVIIDNMMNLELLFWATKYTGDSAYYHAAVSHAETTIKNHFRPDNSSYHVVDYNKSTGEVIGKSTHQGYSDESDWARGQAWGLYGFTMCYKETGNPEFLSQAEKIADYYIAHQNLPEDKVPYWDFLAPGIPSEPRDASAAAIAASALLDLSEYAESGASYLDFAEQTLNTLASPAYFSFDNTEQNFLLMQSTGNKPGNSEINTSINYADYYFLEALGRYARVSSKAIVPYVKTSERIIVSAEETMVDPIYIYDVAKGGFSLSLENAPGFIQLEEIDGNTFEMIMTPGSDDAGSYEISLLLTDSSGNKTYITKHVYVEENNFPDLTVSASQTINNNLASYTLDGDFGTYWESDEVGSWLTYDFGKEFLIDSLHIAFTRGDSQKYSFSAFSSIDADDWNIELYAVSSGEGTAFESFGFQEPKRLRYLKITGYGSDKEGINRYTEVRFGMKEYSVAAATNAAKDIILQHSVLNEQLILTSSIERSINKVLIYNMLGSQISSFSPGDSMNQLSIPLSGLDKGIYIAQVLFDSGESKSFKFLTR